MLLNSLNPISSSLLLKILNPWTFLWSLFLTVFHVWFHFVIFHIFCTVIWFFILEKSFHFDISKFCNVLFLRWFISFTRRFSQALFLLGLFLFLLNAPFLFSECLTFLLTILRVFRLCSTSLVSSTNIIVYNT